MVPAGFATGDPASLKLGDALRYVLSVPTNVALIIASSLNYLFISGILTFGVLFIRHQYSVGQSVATSLLGLLAIAAVVGVLVSGRVADALLRRGRLSGRVTVAAGCVLTACALFLPPILSSSLVLGLPLLWLAGAAVVRVRLRPARQRRSRHPRLSAVRQCRRSRRGIPDHADPAGRRWRDSAPRPARLPR